MPQIDSHEENHPPACQLGRGQCVGPESPSSASPWITEAITTVIHMTGIIMPEGITDMVGTLEEVGIGTIIPMVATRTEGIIVGLTGPRGWGSTLDQIRFRFYPELVFQEKGQFFHRCFQFGVTGGLYIRLKGLSTSLGQASFLIRFG